MRNRISPRVVDEGDEGREEARGRPEARAVVRIVRHEQRHCFRRLCAREERQGDVDIVRRPLVHELCNDTIDAGEGVGTVAPHHGDGRRRWSHHAYVARSQVLDEAVRDGERLGL